jgi:hypothetical protein
MLPLNIYFKGNQLSNKSCVEKDYKSCPFCGGINKIYVYINELKIKTRVCYLCSLIVNFDIQNFNKLILCYSNLSQKEVIQKTMNYYQKNSQVPKPIEIDDKVEKIKLSPMIYLELIKSNYIFDNFVFFFSDLVEELIGSAFDVSVFDDDVKIKKKKFYDISFFDIKVHDFTDKEKDIIGKQKKYINHNIKEEIQKYKILF